MSCPHYSVRSPNQQMRLGSAQLQRRCTQHAGLYTTGSTIAQLVNQQRHQHGSQAALASHRAAAAAAATGPISATARQQVSQQRKSTHAEPLTQLSADALKAKEVLSSLATYTPTGLADGPASLTQVRPYNAAEITHATQHGAVLLACYAPSQLAHIAAALAAAGHRNTTFMEALGSEAARQLEAAAAPDDHAGALRLLRTICFLAVAFSRLGLAPACLFQQLALQGSRLLHLHHLQPSKRSHATHIALLAAAFAALNLHPPQLFHAMAELFKQQRYVLRLLGPQEAMLLCWSFAKLQHQDSPAQLLLTQQATTQVGQLDCQGLAHAYSQCAAAGLTAPPLLAALRKATRQRLPAMHPHQLTSMLVALAGLQQQDQLLLDELAKAIHNKLANFTGLQIGVVFSSCSLLSYRNTWLLDQASRMLVSSKMNKALQLTGLQLAQLLASCKQLQYFNPFLLAHLGNVAADAGLVCSSTAAELADILQGYCLLSYQHSLMQQAAASRLQHLVAVSGNQKQRLLDLQQLVAAVHQLASLPEYKDTGAQGAVVLPAVTAVASAVVYGALHQPFSCLDLIRLAEAVILSAQGPTAEQQEQQQHAQLLQQILQQVGAKLHGRHDSSLIMSAVMPDLLLLMQLLWLTEQLDAAVEESRPAARPQQQELQQQSAGDQQRGRRAPEACQPRGPQQLWHLGLPQQLLEQLLHQHAELCRQQQQQQQQQGTGPPSSLQLLQAVLPAVRQVAASGGGACLTQYCIPDTPMLLPAAVLPAAPQQPAGPGQYQHLEGVSSNRETNSASCFAVAGVQARRRGQQLPGHVAAFLGSCCRMGRPVAVFAAGNAAGGLDDWHTSSVPRVLLPAAALCKQGLLAAGWAVLVLFDAEDRRE